MKIVLPLVHLDNIVFTPLPQLLLKQQLVLDGVCAPEDVSILEFSREDDLAASFSAIIEQKPDVAAFSCYVWNFRAVCQLSKALKDYYGDRVKVVWGGPHVSEKPRWFARTYADCCDYVIGWYGELSFSQLCKAIQQGDVDPSKIPAYTADHDASCAKAPEFDELPLPYKQDWLPDTMTRDIGERVFLLETYRNCPFSCLRGDTLVNTVYGQIKIKELSERFKEVGVYTFDRDAGKVLVSTARNIRRTGKNKRLVRVHFTDGSFIDCTPDHQFSAFTCGRGGLREWDEQAKDLRPGTRVRAVREEYSGPDKNYVQVCSGRERKKKHRMVMEWVLGRELLDTEIVHHKDGDTFNNEPENLEVLSYAKDHMNRHPELRQRMRENNPTKGGVGKEWREKLRKAINGKKRSEETKRRMKEAAHRREARMTDEEKLLRSERTKKMIRAKKAKGQKWGNPNKSGADGRFSSKDGETNHRVSRVEILPGLHDVYCMEVPETSWFFANNILVHNCAYCLWGQAANKVEGRDYDAVMADFEHLLSLGMKHLKFADAGLGVVKKDNRDKRIWRTLADMNLHERGINLRTYFFWQVIDEEWAEIFAKLISQGVIGTMDLGIQTFNPKALTDMKRPTDYDRFDRVTKILQKHKIPYAIDLILGLPGDDLEGFRHSVRTCIGYEPKRFQSFLCSVLPGAGYDLRRDELGIKTIAGSLMDDDEKVVETKTFPRDDVQKALDLEAWLYFVFSLQVCDGAVRKAAQDSGVDPLSAVESLKSWCLKKAPHTVSAIQRYRRNLYDSRQKGRVQCDEYMATRFKWLYLELMEWASLMGVEEEMRDGLLKFPKTCTVASSLHGVDDCYFEQCFITRKDEAYTWKCDPIMGVIGTKYAFWTWDKVEVKEEVPV